MDCRVKPGNDHGSTSPGTAVEHPVVMAGLVPIGANLSCLASSSCAGLTRASIFFARKFLRRSMDCRVKPGNDDLKLAPMGLVPAIHVWLPA
jgi:hypothetical protein